MEELSLKGTESLKGTGIVLKKVGDRKKSRGQALRWDNTSGAGPGEQGIGCQATTESKRN